MKYGPKYYDSVSCEIFLEDTGGLNCEANVLLPLPLDQTECHRLISIRKQ
jgi:hypothetical protein